MGSGNSVSGPARAPIFDGARIRPDNRRYIYNRPFVQSIKVITDDDLSGDIYIVSADDAFKLLVENCETLHSSHPGVMFLFPYDIGWPVGTTVDIMRTTANQVELTSTEGTEIVTPYGSPILTPKWAPSRCTVQLMFDATQDTPYWRQDGEPNLSWYASGDMRPNAYGEIVFSYAGVVDTAETSAPWIAPFDLSVFEIVVAARVDGAADIDFLVMPIGVTATLGSGNTVDSTAVAFTSGAINADNVVSVELTDDGSADVEDVTVTVRYYPSSQLFL